MRKPVNEMTVEELQAAVDKLQKAQDKHGYDDDRQGKIQKYKKELDNRD